MRIENFKGYSESVKIDCSIPWIFLRWQKKTNKLMIYFHGNAEDVGSVMPFMKIIQNSIDWHIIAVEYPGYGVYEGEPSEETVIRDSERVMQFILKVLKWPLRDIIVFGRSIGSGPACSIAANYRIAALVLISPYTSIRAIVKDMFGSIFQYIIKERFNNLENIAKTKCPTFILHGKRDEIIPYGKLFKVIAKIKHFWILSYLLFT